MTPGTKTYLGDGVYAQLQGHQVVLTTEDGVRTTNVIYLEPEVIAALAGFIERAVKREQHVDPQ